MGEFSQKEKLSAREYEVVTLAARGFANKAIARELKITEGTIKIHLHNVYQKLGIKGRLALTLLVNDLPFETANEAAQIDAA